jgi:thiosulfate/3-mercaptopyruvate sulfurtransferase
MSFGTLIDTATLAARLASPSVAVVDCRFMLGDPAWGPTQYRNGHVPGAVFADVETALSGPDKGPRGRHPLPDPHAFIQTLSALGIDASVQVIAYDQDAGMYASRLWWMLRWMGHEAVAVLDGGYSKWIAEGRPVASGVETRARRSFRGTPRSEMVATIDEVRARAGMPDWRVVDARAPERYRGDVETVDKVAGHIPGAVNHPYARNVGPGAVFRPAADLDALFRKTLGGVEPDHVICYCGSGVTACQNLLALEHAGLHGARLYPGSWSEWIEQTQT